MKKILLFLILLVSIVIITCSEEPPVKPPPNPPEAKATLTLQDKSCTEFWLKLELENFTLPVNVQLMKDNLLQTEINGLSSNDTTLYIDSLLPNKIYNFVAVVTAGEQQDTSTQLQATTLDSTNHNLSWQVFTFGEHQHSRLNDVAIVGNEIWAVGEIYMNDSLGQPDTQPYGATIWDGSNWRRKKLFYNTNIPVTPRGIFVVSPTEIYLASGSIFRWDGSSNNVQLVYSRLNLSDPNGTIEKLWGSPNLLIYGAGNAGSIVYDNGQSWQQMVSGTEVDLYDVWGDSEGTIWTCGYSDDYGTTALLRYTGEQWETVYEGNSSSQNNGFYIGPISGIWSCNKHRIYLMNWSGVYIQKNSNELFLEKEIATFSDVGFGIDGTDDNNIFACGEGFVGHFNGISYTEYPELYSAQRTFYEVSVKGNVVCAVGSDYNGPIYSQAVIALSK